MSLALIRSGKLVCVYCGDPATNADHVPAVIYKHYVQPENRYCVPSCRECNAALGCKKLFDVLDRRIWVQQYYQKKYRRILNLPDLDSKEFGYNLMMMVKSGKNAKKWILHRISFSPDNLHDIRFPYYQDSRENQEPAMVDYAGVQEQVMTNWDEELDSLIRNDPWVNR